MRETQCRNIYRQAFSDPDTVFEDMLFKYCYKYCHTIELDGKVVSMLFALPCILKNDSEELNAIYIYAAATEKGSRKKGYMKDLLKQVTAESNFTLLRPANESLINYYSKCGFKILKSGGGLWEIIPAGGYKDLLNESRISDDNKPFTVMYCAEKEFDAETISFNYSMI